MVYLLQLRRIYPKNILNISPPPFSYCRNSGNSVLFLMLAVNAFIPAPFRSGNYVRTLLRTPTLHSACIFCIHLSTARHKYSFSHSIYSVPSVIPMPFSNPFPAVAFLPAASSPQCRESFWFYFGLIWFPKGIQTKVLFLFLVKVFTLWICKFN
jgi:hypothetical protein